MRQSSTDCLKLLKAAWQNNLEVNDTVDSYKTRVGKILPFRNTDFQSFDYAYGFMFVE